MDFLLNLLNNDVIKETLITVFITISGALITFIINQIKTFKLKTKYETLAEISDMVISIVEQLYQEFIEDLKNDGKFTKEEQEKFRKLAIEVIKKNLRKRHWKILRKIFKDFGADTIANILLQKAIARRKDGYTKLFEFDYKF